MDIASVQSSGDSLPSLIAYQIVIVIVSSRSPSSIQNERVLRLARYKRTVRAYVLRRDPVCVHCIRDGCVPLMPSVDADHIVPRALGGAVFDPKNMQGLCERHHDEKSGRDRAAIAAHKREHAEPPKMVDGRPNPKWLDWREQQITKPLSDQLAERRARRDDLAGSRRLRAAREHR